VNPSTIDRSLECGVYPRSYKLLGWIAGAPVIQAEDRGPTNYSPILRVIGYRLPDDLEYHSTRMHAGSSVPLNYAQCLPHDDPARGVDHFVVLYPTQRAIRYMGLMADSAQRGPARLSPVQRAEFAAKSALLSEEADSLPVELRQRLAEWRDDPEFPVRAFEWAILWPEGWQSRLQSGVSRAGTL